MEALGDLIESQRSNIIGCVRSFDSREEAKEEVLSRVYLLVFRNIKQFKFESDFGTWIFSTTRNEVFQFWRRCSRAEKKANMLVERQALEQWQDTEKDWQRVDRATEGKDFLLAIYKMYDRMSRQYKAACWLRDVEGCSIEEVAQRVGNTVAGTKSLIYRGRIQLRRMIAKEIGEKLLSQNYGITFEGRDTPIPE